MHVHILGICGTFMAGVAEIAVQLGHKVSGSDANVYPPMSDFLAARGIAIHRGYDAAQFEPRPDVVLIGNALSRGNDAVEYVLDAHLPYTSGAEWLARTVLRDQHVIAVAGTHGKTTTTSMLAFVLAECGLEPGYLIGGIAHDFANPATIGGGRFFVIEADEYDTAFFDKRSKFVHYRPDTLIINNLEFDHADIFPDLDAIKTQFHHLLRTVPASGTVLSPAADVHVNDVLERGCWSTKVSFGSDQSAIWRIANYASQTSCEFDLLGPNDARIAVQLQQLGEHNAMNASAALVAAHALGVPLDKSADALAKFKGVKRRLETLGVVAGVTVYDDFAHHPSAIKTTLKALRAAVGGAHIHCVLEPRSNTMRLGIHANTIADALSDADDVYLYADDALNWDPSVVLEPLGKHASVHPKINPLVEAIRRNAHSGDHIVIMSNGGFGGIHQLLLNALAATK